MFLPVTILILTDIPRPKKRKHSLKRLNEQNMKLNASLQRLRRRLKKMLLTLLLQMRPKQIVTWMIGRLQLLRMMTT